MRRLPLVLLGWLLSVSTASALQLGEIELTATPPQPIEARIALLHATPAAIRDARVSLADDRRHARAGINPARQPDQLSLSLHLDADKPAILLQLPENTPPEQQAFDFIVEIDWSGGQLARAYGLALVDGQLQARALGDAQFGPTQRADTLYSIANALRPPAVATNQMMLALLAENPDRFNAPNINALQRGVMLRLPQPQALQFPARDQANAEVRRQLADWGQPAEPTPSVIASDGQAEPVDATTPTPAAGAEAPALRLLPPQASTASDDAAEFGEAEFAALAEQLTRVEQANQQLASQNQQLQRAIDSLQADVIRLERLLVEGQRQTNGADQPAASQTSEPITAEAVAEWVQNEFAAVMAEPSMALQRPWSRGLIVGITVFFALLLLAWLLGRRRPTPKKTEDDALPAQWRPQTGRPERTDAIDEAELGPTAVRPTEVVAGDPLERASELIAYGQLAQAQSVLDDALGETPDSIGLRLRLLEVLAMRGDRAGFESEAHVLHAQINDDNDPRWQRIARQGREISPDHPLFATAE